MARTLVNMTGGVYDNALFRVKGTGVKISSE
jgi:hypothetical protein